MTLLPSHARRTALAALVAVVAFGCKKQPKPDAADEAEDGSGPAVVAPARPAPAFDAEGLPLGNDLDSILVRLNHRYRQNNAHLYQLEIANLRFVKEKAPVPGKVVFQTFRAHAGTAQPAFASIPFFAWQQTMNWASPDEVPELCQMLRAEQVEARQSDLFTKLEEFKDSRCAETVAPFLAVPARRGRAEHLLKDLDATTEKFVLPYLAAGHDKDTRVAALQVVAQVGSDESAKAVEAMTRDTDLYVNHHAKIVFEKLSARMGTEQDLIAVVAALKAGIAAENGVAIGDNSNKLDKAYRPDHPRRAEIFKRLIECCKAPDPKGYGKRASYLGALKWSSADDLAALCDLLVFSGGESVVFLKLKEYKDARCADTVAWFLSNALKSGEAADVLKAVGAAAEKSVIPYTMRAYPNGAEIAFATRLTAIDLLGDIGTKESIGLLRRHAAELNVRAACEKALAKVASRSK